ncbi:peptidyl-prolyl cis-trans isomerase B [Mycobacterium tuberculosis variant microti]|nr:peptidyl-prolyl cis-trans isomerase B [Mycobacterium tuberculosis variant microti]
MINTVPSFPSPASGDEAGREHGPLDTGRGAPISLCFRADQCSATCHSQTQTRTTTRAPRQASQTPSHLDYRRWLTRSGGRDRRGSRHGGGQQGRPPEHHVSNPHRLGLDQPPQAATAPPLPPFKPSANLGANCQYPPSPDKAVKPVKLPRTGKVPTDPAQVSVSMVTNQGNIGLMLANNESPCTVNSFVSLAQQGFFKGTTCHRLTTSPMLAVLQCGDPKGDGTGGPGYQFANEYPTDQYSANDPKLNEPVIYPRGTLAMANAGPNTNSSQFFMVYRDSKLPPQYTVFGTIQADGLTTLDKVAKAGVAGGGEDGKPATEVTITSVLLD